MASNLDKYQDRYLKHQEKKKKQLMFSEGYQIQTSYVDIPLALNRRRSQRVFISKPITYNELDAILWAATVSPSSCNRHGISLKVIDSRSDKELLSGLLVGGIGWVHRADKIILLLADPDAYKSPNEKEFMHYCDAGFKAMAMWMMAEHFGLGACYINPNITHKDIFASKFGGRYIFCGALAIGHYEKRAFPADRPSIHDILL